MNKVKGGKLMLFIGDQNPKSIAFATNHTFSINASLSDTSNKDESAGGDWSSQEPNLLDWSIDTENLYSLDGEGNNFSDLFDIAVSKQKVKCVFALAAESGDNVPTGGWSPATPSATSPIYEGNAVISSLQLNAPNGEYASMTATFTGIGAIAKKNS